MKTVKHEDGSETKHCLRTTHAEINAIALAAKKGIAIEGATLYTLLEPCVNCAKALVTAGIKKIVCQRKYHVAAESRDLFDKVGVKIVYLIDETMEYEGQ